MSSIFGQKIFFAPPLKNFCIRPWNDLVCRKTNIFFRFESIKKSFICQAFSKLYVPDDDYLFYFIGKYICFRYDHNLIASLCNNERFVKNTRAIFHLRFQILDNLFLHACTRAMYMLTQNNVSHIFLKRP